MAKAIPIGSTTGPSWLDGLLRNDPQIVRGLYTRHFPAVRQYVLDNSGTMDDAEDMFQEAFLVLWLKVKEGHYYAEAAQDPGGFLFQVAKHKWLDVLRSAAKRNMRMLRDDHAQAGEEPVEAGLEERIGRLREVYGRLDAKCRQVLDLFYFGRKDLAAIALAMGVEEASIRTIKYRCMMKLRASRLQIGAQDRTDE